MLSEWVHDEFYGSDFNDSRLSARLKVVADCFFRHRSGSIYSCSDEAKKVKATNRFFANEKVDMAGIHAPHLASTVRRATGVKFALNIQDTSGLNYDKHNSKIDIGHIGSSPNRRDSLGYWLHSGFMCDEKGVPLGISYQEIWARSEVKSGESRNERKVRLRDVPLEEKESQRWLEGAKACQDFRDVGVAVVQICDREADIFEFMSLCTAIGDNFLIRAKSNRSVVDIDKETETLLFDAVSSKKIQATTSIEIIGNSEREAKTINVGIRWCDVELKVPKSNRSRETVADLEPVAITVIKVTSKSEVNGKPIEWFLLTNMRIKTQADAIRLVGWYAMRWRIEIFHKVLKSGLGIEDCRLKNLDRMSSYIMLKSIIAYKIMLMTYYFRENPNERATSIFEDDELRLLLAAIFPGQKKESPTVKEVILRIAAHGGFFPNGARKPGVSAIWKGWEAVSHKMEAVSAYI
jgi:hypothetical protein